MSISEIHLEKDVVESVEHEWVVRNDKEEEYNEVRKGDETHHVAGTSY